MRSWKARVSATLGESARGSAELRGNVGVGSRRENLGIMSGGKILKEGWERKKSRASDNLSRVGRATKGKHGLLLDRLNDRRWRREHGRGS